jgi:transposase-like protein
MQKLLKNHGLVPTSIVTDRYRTYDVAFRDLAISSIHLRGKRLNNRAESSHVPIRRRNLPVRRNVSVPALGQLQHLQRLPSSDHRQHSSGPAQLGNRRMEYCCGRLSLTAPIWSAARLGATNVTDQGR